MSRPPVGRSVRFGRFELSPSEHVLRADGRPLTVGARAFDVLACLVQRRERVVTKQELLDLVWPGLVVEEHNVATQIGTLRKLLGPRAITTIPGRGYRFTAPGAVDAGDEPQPEPAAAPAASDRLTPLLGRDGDLAALAGHLEHDRVVTIVGAGGIGKSLLARHLQLRLATRWPNGSCWVDLTSIDDASQLPYRIAEGAGVRLDGEDTIAALALSLGGLELLLVLDNAEHLLDAVAGVVAVLADTGPGLRLLVTSQVPLRLAGERAYRLAPLAVPDKPLPAERARAFASVALFVERARGAAARFEFDDARAADVIELCRQLDGLPLAIELAAVRAPLLGVQRLVAMLGNRLQLLTRSRDLLAPARQQTLRAALEWSHELLDETERTVFRRLGVVVGSATLGTVQQIVADAAGPLDAWAVLDALGALVDRSLVVVVAPEDGEPRYRLLESPRAFALERLDAAGERASIERRHAQSFAAQFRAAWDERFAGRIGQRHWQRRTLLDADNARAAIAWAVAADEPEIAVAIAATLYVALPRSSLPERVQHAELCESLADRLASPELQLRALDTATRPMYHPSPVRSTALAARAVALARTLDRGAPDRWPLYAALCTWVWCAGAAADPPREELRAALADIEAIEDPDWPAVRLFDGLEARRLAWLSFDEPGRDAELLRIVRRQAVLIDAAGGDPTPRLSLLIDAELGAGNAQAAIDIGERALAQMAGTRDAWSLWTVQGALAMALLAQDAAPRARPLLEQAWRTGLRYRVAHLMSDLPALLAAVEGRPRAAAQLLGHADSAYAGHGVARYPTDVAVRERCLAMVRAALGAAVADALVTQGLALHPDEVTELAFAVRDLG